MKKHWIVFPILLLTLTASFAGCRKKPAQVPGQPAAPEARKEQVETLKLLEHSGLKAYPKSEVLDSLRKSQESESPAEEKSAGVSEVTVARVWLSASDPVEKVQEYYKNTHPYVLTKETRSDGSVFLQLSSVEKIATAIAQGVSPITLVDIRKKKLTSSERSAYEGELKNLNAKPQKDLIDKDRISELERLLAEKTIIKLSLRAEKA